jgi:HlyD family secretion protein
LACGKKQQAAPTIATAPVERRDIVVNAEASGTVEPINVIEVKSKASGQITRMPVETGTQVKPGDLLVQVDTRDVQNQYNQALADVRAAESRLDVTRAQRQRSEELFQQKIITAQERETAQLDYANAEAQVVRARASLDIAQQRLEEATVRAPVAGTIIEKSVSLGQVIASATGTFGGGTTLLKMADLDQVRVRAMVAESDIGQVQSGQSVTVTVDAYPDRPFTGLVEKIEPQAVVQQNVTMFPVLVSVSNRERLLMPGMNGEVSVLVSQRNNVLTVPNDAIRSPREAAVAATALGLDPERVQQQLRDQFNGGGATPTNGSAAPGAPARTEVARGEIAPEEPQQGGMQLPDVSDAQCQQVQAAFVKNPSARAKLDTLRQRVRSGEADMQSVRGEMQAIYGQLGVDAGVARACMARQRQAANGGAPANGSAPAVSARAGAAPRQAQGSSGAPSMQQGAPETRVRARPGLVFVAKDGTFEPRIVRLGISNYDYTEVIAGVEEGDQVALLAAAALQQQRQQNIDRIRGMTGGGVPGMQRQSGSTPQRGGGGR